MNGHRLRAAVCLGLAAAIVGAGCTTSKTAEPRAKPAASDPWQATVHYVDPAGRFGLDFPSAPALSSEPDGSLVIHTLRTSGSGDWGFELAWSDALPGSSLVPGQTLSPQTPQQNAAGDGGKVTHQATVPMFGRDAIEFTVESLTPGQGLYRDREVVIGGRLYEFTVLQRSGGSAPFDRFVRSFRLLEPPARAGADFFGRASAICTALGSLGARATEECNRGAARGRGIADCRPLRSIGEAARHDARGSEGPGRSRGDDRRDPALDRAGASVREGRHREPH